MTKDEAVVLIGLVGLAISLFVILRELGIKEDESETETHQDSETQEEAQKKNDSTVT